MYQQQQQQQIPIPIPVHDSDSTPHPHVAVAPNCPRCASSNTKFCYYNNYSLTQPRYFCKACRRYWTKGGSLRNVPVGGGCRKTRRSRSKAHRATPPHHSNNDNSSSSSSGHSSGNGNGPDIDMAAVFARYVSQGDAAEPPIKNDDQASTWRPENDDLDSFDFEMVVTDDFYWSTMAPLAEMEASPAPLVDELLASDASWSDCFDVAGCGDFYI